MLKIDVKSIDRIGITQEILHIFVENQWDLGAVEMHLHHTFATIRDYHVTLDMIKPLLLAIEGVEEVKEIDHLPTEFKQNQVNTLLSSIPNPILRLSPSGYIEDMNDAAQKIWGPSDRIGLSDNFFEIVNGTLSTKELQQSTHKEIYCAGHPYLAQIEPIKNETLDKNIGGAIVFLHNMNQIGMHISAVSGSATNLIGTSAEMQQIKKQIHRVSSSDFPILINGETGTGKELVAKNCHELSHRNGSPFLAINCAALPENLLESELFGYAPGAFSGAKRTGKPGLFELAEGGTLFLDEIGEMSPYLQAKMLRFLQDFTFRRVGGVDDIKANVRIISATHRNLEEMVAEETFREDLFYRLNVLRIKLPALRHRKKDIPTLIEYFLEKAMKQTGRTDIKIDAQTIEKMTNYPWPGNIRELENRLFRAVVMSEGNLLNQDFLIPKNVKKEPNQASNSTDLEGFKNLKDAMKAYEENLIQQLLPLYPSTRKLASRLGVSHNTVALKLREYGIKK